MYVRTCDINIYVCTCDIHVRMYTYVHMFQEPYIWKIIEGCLCVYIYVHMYKEPYIWNISKEPYIWKIIKGVGKIEVRPKIALLRCSFKRGLDRCILFKEPDSNVMLCVCVSFLKEP